MLEKLIPIEADLTLLRSQMPTKRRQSRRFRCNLATMAKLQLPDSDTTQVTWAYNLSLGGVGLNASAELPVDQKIIIHFKTIDNEIHSVPAKIIFCRLEIDRTWRIGCAFDEPLSQTAMDALLN